jgi:hypothetical protein
VLVTPKVEKKVLECHSGLNASEKELLEWRSVTKIPLLLMHQNSMTSFPVAVVMELCANSLWNWYEQSGTILLRV